MKIIVIVFHIRMDVVVEVSWWSHIVSFFLYFYENLLKTKKKICASFIKHHDDDDDDDDDFHEIKSTPTRHFEVWSPATKRCIWLSCLSYFSMCILNLNIRKKKNFIWVLS